MKIKSYLLLGLAAFALASCDESFNDWTEQNTNAQSDAIQFGNASIQTVDLIDFTNIEEGTDSVQICRIDKAPTATKNGFAPKYTVILNDGESTQASLNMGTTGKVAYAEFKNYVESTYGKYPTERDITAKVKSVMKDDMMATYLVSDAFIVKAAPANLGLTDTYKLIIGEEEYELSNGGGNPYDSPNFTVTINSPSAGTSYTIVDANGEPVAEDVIPAQGKFIISFNAISGSSSADKAPSVLYMAGNANGWGQKDYLIATDEAGNQFKGYMYLDAQGFKFCTQDDWYGTNYGAGDKDGKLSTTGGNIEIKEAGYYQVEINLQTLTYTLTPIKNIGIIGTATPKGWDADTDLTYNVEERCWEIKDVTLKDGEMKFRSNHDWISNPNWGGTLDKLTNNGDNIKVKAGTYDIKLYAWANGYAYATMTKK